MAKILVIRLSAIGDVAMTVPVIYSAAKANPQDTFTVLTQAFLIPVFMNRPANVDVIGINTKAAEKTLPGLLRFASALVKFEYDMVLDLHNVIRTIIIRSLFRIKGKKVYVVDKARKERKNLTDRNHKELKPLRPVIERYADVFRAAGLNYMETFTSLYESHPADLSAMEAVAGTKNGKWIGIAPFAKHRGKIYPIDDMEQVVARLSENEDYTIFLLGGRGYEEAVLEQWAFQYPRVKSLVGRYSLDNELALISRLDVLLCMGFRQYAFCLFGRNESGLYLGSDSSVCGILWLSPGSEECCSAGSAVPSLFCIRTETLFSGRLGLYDAN